jgi:hypothetical protein
MKMTPNRSVLCWLAASILTFAVAACGDDHDHHDSDDHDHDHDGAAGAGGGDDPAVLACAERDEAGESLTASSAPDESAPALEIDGEPRTVALPDGEAGYVRVEIGEDTFALLLLEAENVVTGLYHGDEEEELISAGPVDPCADDIPEHFDVDFHEAGTYYVRLGPSALPEVWLVLADGAGHGDDDHSGD